MGTATNDLKPETDPAAARADAGARPPAARFFAGLILLAIPGSLFTAAATVPVGLAALYGLSLRLAGWRAPRDIATLFWVFGGCYVALLATDIANGGGVENFQFTALNYLPLLGTAGVAFVLRLIEVPRRWLLAAMALAMWTGVILALVQNLLLGDWRPGGLNINPNPYSLVVSLWSIMLMAFALREERHRLVLIVSAVAGVVPLALAQSKVAWVGALVGHTVVIAWWAMELRRWRSLAIAVGGMAILLWVAYVLVAHVRISMFIEELQLFLTTGELTYNSFGQRFAAFEAGLAAFMNGPLLGYGFAEVLATAITYLPANSPRMDDLDHLHNDYLTHMVAYGYVGIAFLLVFYATLVWIAWNADGPARRSAGFALALVCMIYMSAEILLNIEPVTGPLMLLIGIVMTRDGRFGKNAPA